MFIGVVVTIAAVNAVARGRDGLAGASPAANAYRHVADTTLHGCSPQDPAAFARCAASFDAGTRQLALSGAAQSDLAALKPTLTLAQTCVAAPSHDDPNVSEWQAGCPQADSGDRPDPSMAKSRDIATDTSFLAAMTDADAQIHRDLGDPPSGPAPGSAP